MPGVKFDYDEENDLLFLYKEREKSKGSVEIGNIVLDFNNKGDIVAIEFLEASQLLSAIAGLKIEKSSLNEIVSVEFELDRKTNPSLLKLFLGLKGVEIKQALTIPLVEEKSPALAY